jgi:hypothetical protein
VATLFIDFGDAFPAGGLQMTSLQLHDDIAVGGIQGPNLTGLGGRLGGGQIADATNLRFTPLPPLGPGTVLRAAVVSLVQRYYAPLNIDVQVDANANLAGIQADLQANDGLAVGKNDAYVFVTDVVRLDTGNHVGADIGAFGIAALPPILAQANIRDNSAVVFADNELATFPPLYPADTALGDTIAHEAGHDFGLRHVNGGFAPSGSEIIQAGGDITPHLRYDFFTGYPLPQNPGEMPPIPPYSPLEQFLADPDIGPRPGFPEYVTGTGAPTVVSVTSVGGGMARVDVTAFLDPGHTIPIPVPLPGVNDPDPFTHRYFINTANGILIDAGANFDTIILDANLNTAIQVRGMSGTDQLVINNNGAAAAATYTPDLVAPVGLDAQLSFGGLVTIGATIVRFDEFEPTGSVLVQGVPNFTFTGSPAGNDVITIGHPAQFAESVAGSVAGVPFVPLAYVGPAGSNLTVNLGLGNNIVNVVGTDLNLTTTVNLGPGANVVTVGGPVSGLFDVLGPLAVVGAGGPTALAFNDQANPFNTTYTITAAAVNRPGWTFTYAGVVSLTFNGGSGNNVYNILSTALGTTTIINAGPRADVIAIGGPVNGLFDVLGPLFVNGGGGPTALVFNDQANPFNTTYTITTTAVNRPGWTFTYARVASLVFNGGSGNDVYNVLGTVLGTVTTINTGPNANLVAIGGPNNGLFDVIGPLFVNGGGGPSALVFNDQANRFNTTYTITATAVNRPGWTFTYAGVVSLTFNGGSGSNVYNVRSTAVGTTTYLNAGPNSDVFNIGGPNAGLGDILGPMFFNGGAGATTVNLDDRAWAPLTTYTVTATTVSRPGALFNYAGVRFLNLLIRQPDIVDVLSLPPLTTFQVFRF